MNFFTKTARLAMCLTAVCVATYANSQRILGDWSGQLKVTPQMMMKIVIHINDNAVSLDSPDQGAYGIPGEIVHFSDDSVNFSIPKIMAGFAGRLKGDTLSGVFTQGGMRLPLELTKGLTEAKRPQTPRPPFPYSTEELKISTDAATIAGTLTVPENADKKTPLLVMVSGSGLQNRDEELFEHKPFAVIADYLARRGIASFRYDDRGVGESTGETASATTADFAADAKAAVDFLRDTGRFGKTGLLGHSEGGMIAYMLGAKPETLDFIISIAGPAIKGSKTIGYQNKMSLMKAAISETDADDFGKAIERAFDYKTSHPEAFEVTDSLIAMLYPQHNASMITRTLAGSLKKAISEQASNPWMMYFLAYDPAPDLKAIDIPALIIYGGKDCQVPPSLNADVARGLAPKAIVKVFPDLNHMMQHALTGYVEEYKDLEETISPEVLETIAGFISR